MTDLPSEVKVGPFVFTVRGGADVVDYFDGAEGEDTGDCDSHGLIIRVSGKTAEGHQRDTTWHECLHAAAFACGLSEELTEKVEEKVVRQLATATLGVLRDNPDLVAYLTTP